MESSRLKVSVIIKLEPDFSEGNVSYNSDGTLNRAETKSILGPHSAVASMAALNAKVMYNADVSVGTMGPPIAEQALQQSQLICDADELHLYSDRIFAGADTLATAEVLRAGVNKMHEGVKSDIVFSGHRASDGETGQTGPQTAWKLGYTFFGNVIGFSVDLVHRLARVTRLVPIQGLHDVIEELEAPLPIFVTIHPSYKPVFTTVSQRLTFFKCQKESRDRSALYKNYLKTFNAQTLGVDPKLVGLPGSPTIVYRVEKIPRAKTSRMAEIVDGSKRDQIKAVAKKITDMVKVK
ncbi:MAG TPA: electron transfer flavoprotein subunit beta [Nitrososphaeraceae archaeon]